MFAFARGITDASGYPYLRNLYLKMVYWGALKDLFGEGVANRLVHWSGETRAITLRMRGLERIAVLPDRQNSIAVFDEIFRHEAYRPPGYAVANVVVDGGANVGLATLYLSFIYPKALFLCFEPEPGNFELLKRTMGHNPGLRAICRQKALSGDAGRATLHLSNSEGSHSLRADHGARAGLLEVATTTIDDEVGAYVRQTAEPMIFIKLDVEGAELSALAGAKEALRSTFCLVGEIHHASEMPALRALLARSDLRVQEARPGIFLATPI
jgi:FkbM family methyltransferase